MAPGYYFLFAFFIFTLIAAVVFLVDRLKRSRNTDLENLIKDKEKRVFKLYQNLEDLISSVEEYAEETKDDMRGFRDESMAILQSMQRFQQVPASKRREAAEAAAPAAAIMTPVPQTAQAESPQAEPAPADKKEPVKEAAQPAAAQKEAPAPAAKPTLTPAAKQAATAGAAAARPTAIKAAAEKKVPPLKPANAAQKSSSSAKAGKPAEKPAQPANAKPNEKETPQKAAAKAPQPAARLEAQQVPKPAAQPIMQKLPEQPKAAPKRPPEIKRPPEAAKGKSKGKVDDVRRLSNQGLDEEQIAKELGLSRGEVSLITGMLKK